MSLVSDCFKIGVWGYDLCFENFSQDVFNYVINIVDGEDVKGIINVNQEFEFGGEVVVDIVDNINNDGIISRDKVSSRSNVDEIRDGIGVEVDGVLFFFKMVVQENLGYVIEGSGKVGDVVGEDGLEVYVESRVIVEVELINLQEDCIEDYVGDVVWMVRKIVIFVVVGVLVEYEGVGKSVGIGGNVDWIVIGKVVVGEVVQLVVIVLGLVGNGIVDNGGLDEDEDEGGQNVIMVGDSINGQSWGDGCKYILVQSEQNVRNVIDILVYGFYEIEMVEGIEERVVSVGEGEGVVLEELLERDDID